MDFTNLEDESREAQLDFPKASSLLRFVNFQRERRNHPPLHATYDDQICERLMECYPGVTFTCAGRQVVASVKDSVSSSLVEEIGFVSRQIPHLTITTGFGSTDLLVIFRADGVGVIKEISHYELFERADGVGAIKENSHYEFFETDLNLEEIEREHGGDEETINKFLQGYFHETINPQMEDPFFDPAGMGEDCELHFEKGANEELDRLMRLFILTEPDIDSHEDEDIILYAAMEGLDPCLESSGCYFSERLDGLTRIALLENRPAGWSLIYTDGAVNRRSGYRVLTLTLRWDIGEILEQSSAREKMVARRDLRQWLQRRGHNPSQFDAPANSQ